MTWEAQSVIALDSVTSARSSITSPIDALSLTAKMPGVANPAWMLVRISRHRGDIVGQQQPILSGGPIG